MHYLTSITQLPEQSRRKLHRFVVCPEIAILSFAKGALFQGYM